MNILFIYAHLDDETILSYGTMKKFKEYGHKISLVTFCKNRKNDPQPERFEAYCQNMNKIGVDCYCNDAEDLSLNENSIKFHLDKMVDSIKPDFVVTHSMHDIHFEHRMIAEQVLLKTRSTPSSSVRKLWMTTSSTYNWTYGKYGQFQPNVFVDISNFMQEKLDAMSLYYNEIPTSDNDNRSLHAVVTWNKMYGSLQNVGFCEPYEQIFSLE